MRNSLFKVLILSLFTVSLSANEVDNGGQLVAARFVKRGWHILRHLEEEQTDLLTEKQRIDYQLALYATDVHAIPGPLKSSTGLIVDAKYIKAKKLIEIDQDKWEELLKQPDIDILVFHEYLRATGIDDKGYHVSSRLNTVEESNFADGWVPGLYKTSLGKLSRLTKDGRLAGETFTAHMAPFSDGHTRACVLRTPHRFHFVPATGVFETQGKCVSGRCRYPATVSIRFYKNEIEMTLKLPNRHYGNCEHFGFHESLITGVRVKERDTN